MNSQRSSSGYSLLVFVFFIAGGIVASLMFADFPDIESTALIFDEFGFMLIPIGLSFILSMTVFGVFIMPVCSFACGASIAYLAQNVLSAGNGYRDYRDICAFLCILVPAFFVICSGGMYTSTLVREAVARAKPQIKTSFRSYILAASVAAAAVYLAGYIINKI